MDAVELVRSYAFLLLVTVFITAGMAKFANRGQFRSTLDTLAIFPAWSLQPVSVGVPLAEILIAALLVSG